MKEGECTRSERRRGQIQWRKAQQRIAHLFQATRCCALPFSMAEAVLCRSTCSILDSCSRSRQRIRRRFRFGIESPA